MSWNPSLDPVCPDAVAVEAIETLIVPRARDIGDFEVCRALPAPKRQMVGPFIFFDQMGPAEFVSGRGVDVRRIPILALRPSPTSSAASSSTAIAWARTRSSSRAPSTGWWRGAGSLTPSERDSPSRHRLHRE